MITDDLANGWLDTLRGVAQPALTVYLVPHVGAPGALGTSNPSTVTARHLATFVAAVDATLALESVDDWPMDADQTITHLAAWSAASAGTFLFPVELQAERDVTSADSLHLDSLVIQLTDAADATVTEPDPVGQDAGIWAMVFRDEFSGTVLDTTKWDPRLPEQVHTNNSSEVQYYPDDFSQVAIAGGAAIITATASAGPTMENGQARQFLSGILSTAPTGPDFTSPGFAVGKEFYWEIRARTD
jgi:hypothetical protein